MARLDGCATNTQIRTAMGGDSSSIAIVTRLSERPTPEENARRSRIELHLVDPANSRADQVFAIRNMLANTSFAQSVAHVPAPKEGSVGPALTQSVMGDYYPTASRYNIKVVEKVGPITCRGKSLVTAQN